MFTQTVNAACNNILFTTEKIACMHESMARLYQVTANNEGVELGPSELARAMNESPQVIKNWETRGLSLPGALKAQEHFKCNANWLLGSSIERNLTPIQRREVSAPALHVAEPRPWEWPFVLVERHRYMALPEAEQHQIQTHMMDEIKALEQKLAKANGTSDG